MSVSLNIEEFFSSKQSIIEIYPICNVAARFETSGVYVVYILLDKNTPLRFNLLGKLIPDISTKVLSIYFMDIENLPSHSLQFFLMIQRKILKTTPKRMLNKIQTDS